MTISQKSQYNDTYMKLSCFPGSPIASPKATTSKVVVYIETISSLGSLQKFEGDAGKFDRLPTPP